MRLNFPSFMYRLIATFTGQNTRTVSASSTNGRRNIARNVVDMNISIGVNHAF